METTHIPEESSATLEVSKSAKAEETSTLYRSPTCEDSTSDHDQNSAQLPKNQKPIRTSVVEDRKLPVTESSFSKQSTVTWSEFPPTRYPPPESITRFSQATTATPHKTYQNRSILLVEPPTRALSPGDGPSVAPVDSLVASKDPSNRFHGSQADILVEEYTSSEDEDESEDSWDLIPAEITPEDSASRPPSMPQNTRASNPQPLRRHTATIRRPTQRHNSSREVRGQRLTDRGSVNIAQDVHATAGSTSSLEGNLPYVWAPPQHSIPPWDLPQSRYSSLPALSTNLYLPQNHAVHPYSMPYPTMVYPPTASYDAYHGFPSNPPPPNRRPQDQPPRVRQAKQTQSQNDSPTASLNESTPPTQIDPIELVEEYLESLRKSKESELSEASRILTWIDQRSAKQVSKDVADVLSSEVPNNESDTKDRRVPTMVSFARTPGQAEHTYEMPLELLHQSGQQNPDSMTERMIDESRDVSARSLYSDHTARAYVPSRYTPSIGPPQTIIHDPKFSDIKSLENNQSISDASEEDDDDRSLLEEINSLRQDNALLRQQLDRKDEAWYGTSIFNIYARWKRSFRTRPALGKRRFYWTCECGEEMFADLPLTNKNDCQQMLEFLSRPSEPRDQDETTPSQLERGIVPSNQVAQNPSPSSLDKGKAPASTISSGTTRIDSSRSQSLQLQSDGSYSRAKYLELCVNVGKYKTRLAEIPIAAANRSALTICTDGHLFQKIHNRYYELRQNSWRRFLYRPAGIRFVHFAVQQNEEVIFYSEDQYPTEDVLSRKLYEYDLRPPIPPPMDSRTFLHYFYEHKAHSQLRSAKFVQRLPKKLGQSLIQSIALDEFREGWGIHIMEGANKVAICWALMIVLLMSLVVSLLYDLMTKTEDSGFAIGQWMVAALTVALSALYFSLEDEVNSNFD